MPRKCCTIFDGESCRTNYNATKTRPFEGGAVYRFPHNLDEQSNWEKCLPNKLPDTVKGADSKISKDIGICYKHFPSDCPTKKQPGGSLVPTVPPSIFGNTSSALFVQTAVTSPREPDKRNVTAEARAEAARSIEEAVDNIDSYANLVKYCTKFSPELVVDTSDPTTIRILQLNGRPPEIEFSLFIKDEFHVEAYRKHMKVLTRDLINGFFSTVMKYSQIDMIIDRLKSTPVNVRYELSSLGNQVLNLADEVDVTDGRRQINFTGKQLLAFDRNRYSEDDMADAINLYLRSRNSYRALRDILHLPSRNTICDYFGKNGLAGGETECIRTINNVFSALNEGQKDCFISFDEIHIKPGLQYQGKYVLGNAQNKTEPTPAKTMLAVMVNPSYGAPAFVARLLPVSCLTADFLFEIVKSVIKFVHDAGGYVFGIMSDNLSVNQKTFKMFQDTFKRIGVCSVTHPFPNSKFAVLFTLYDPTHLFKNIRNNWITEKSQTLEFIDPETNETCTAKWKHLIEIYNSDLESDLKATKLDYKTLHPNNFEKQKVHLACNVFNEKTCAVLDGKTGMEGTSKFIKLVTRMWNILNIRSCDIAARLNDPDRETFTDPNDPRLDFLLKMATMFKQMDNSVRWNRVKGLTGETANALHRTLVGIVELIRILLNQGYAYVLPGKFSSDRIEGEFGICRQSSGGNFTISAEQVFNSLKLQRIKLFSQLDIHIEDEDISNDCCTVDLKDSENDLELIEKCFEEASDLNQTEKSSLYYICGYVARKQQMVCEDAKEVVSSLPKESEFTLNLSRGKLKLPPINLYDLSQYYYAFFKARGTKCCTKIFMEAFKEIHNYTGYNFENIDRINRRFCNTFFKAFVKKATDNVKFKDQRDTKRRRLSGRDR